jgi:hypothetical protein
MLKNETGVQGFTKISTVHLFLCVFSISALQKVYDINLVHIQNYCCESHHITRTCIIISYYHHHHVSLAIYILKVVY